MFHIFFCIIPIFLIIAIGYVIKNNFIDLPDFWRGSEKITYYLLFPALLINALVTANMQQDLHVIILPLILATLVLGFTLILFQKKLKIEKKSFTSYFQGSVRYNSYVFIGVASTLYGVKALPIVAIVIAYMIILTNVFSVIVMSLYLTNDKPNLWTIFKNILKNPLVVSCLIGVVWNKTGMVYPSLIQTLLALLGGAALPLSLLCVGAGLKFGNLAKNIQPIMLTNTAKLVALPILSFIFMSFFSVPNGLIKDIAILYTAVPCAGNAYILAHQMGGDHETMAGIISTTTLFSMLSMPIIMSILLHIPFSFH
jgi:malonate transporter and related proteins